MLCDEEISDGGEGRYETLQTSGGSVTLHLVLPFSQWQMRILRSIVETLMGPVFDRWHEVTFGRTIGAEFVGDDPLGWQALLLQQSEQQSPCSPGVAPALNDFIENA